MTTHKAIVEETSKTEIDRIFKLQQSHHLATGNKSVSERRAILKKLLDAIMKYRPQIKEALFKDYKKHPSEVDLTEVYPITSEIKHARSELSRWADKEKVGTPIALIGSSSYIHYEPKGVVLIVSPWNFPFNLTFGPLVSAIAAGNNVIIKPSEITPHSSALINKIVTEIFDESQVAVIEGGVTTATNILSLPFNHIFFTGSPSVGKIVMKAASEHLTSVTLELGGKSPTIVDETASISTAARRIAWGKCLNNGQVCIAPDYVYVHENIKDTFLMLVKKYIDQFYEENPAQNDSYSRIVNENHFGRVKSYIDDAVSKGAKIEYGGQSNKEDQFIAPTVLSNVSNESTVMTNEIFGPILPVFTFKNVNEAIDEVNKREKPLALYIYSKNNKNIDYIMENTRAGGTCINHSAAHFFNTNLPFGGSNNSGIGKAHGHEGFKAFSNARGVLKQHIPNALERLLPPYDNFKQTLIDLTIKYF